MVDVCVNKIIKNFDTDEEHLILWISPENKYGYWHNLSGKSRTPKRFEIPDIIQGQADGLYEIEDFIALDTVRSEETLTIKEKDHRERVWCVMQPIVEAEPDIYERSMRADILRVATEQNGFEKAHLYKLLDRYWRTGKTKNAFIPAYHNSGARGKQRESYKKKNISISSDAAIGKTLTDIDRKNFATAVNKYYLSREKISLKATYEKLLQHFYTVKSDDGKLKMLAPYETPSFRQFHYWYGKNRDAVSEQKKRNGENTFNLNGRGVLGKSDFGMMGPGSQFQIDATVGDIYLVSQFDRSNIIGRPVIYFVIDAFSRMVTGVSVGLEGPSWASAMIALSNMAANKVPFCNRYGIEIEEKDWPCHHVPASLLGDRGELESKNANNLVNMLGIRIINAPPYRADLKGIIEQHFRTVNTTSVALLPGSVKPDMAKRGGKDYRLDATLDIRQFTQIIIKCVLYYNNHHYMDYFEKSEAMIADNVEAIPAKLWYWGIRHYSGALRFYPEDVVRLAVMPTSNATVTPKGIKFKNIFYICDRAVSEAWFEKARSRRTWSVPISYDPRDMEHIYIWNKDEKKHEVCTLLDWNNKNAGKCLDEIIYEQRMEKFVGQRMKSAEMEAKLNLNSEIDSIVSEAKNMSNGNPVKSKKERLSGIRENRRHEKENMRTSDKLIAEDSNVADGQNINRADESGEDISSILQMIKRKAEERLKK